MERNDRACAQALQELQSLMEELGYAQVNPALLSNTKRPQPSANSLSTRLRSLLFWLKPTAL
jgi:hypothetical protein